MAVVESKKFLRIGVFRGKQRLEESVVKKRRTVSIGQDESNTFCILSSAVPKKWNLFVYDSTTDRYTLCVKRSMRGRVVLDKGREIAIDEKTAPREGVTVRGDDIHIALPNTARGRIATGKVNILFQFVSAQDELAPESIATRMRLESSAVNYRDTGLFTRVFVLAFILSILFHVIPIMYVELQDWPRDDEFFALPVPPKPVVIEEMKVLEENEPDPEPMIVEESENVIPDVPSVDVDTSSDPGSLSNAELMDRITDEHIAKGAVITAQVLGVEGGVEGYFAELLGSNSHIADMSDIAAGDIGASASGNLFAQLANTGGGTGAGLLGVDSGSGNGGPKVIVNGNQQKRDKERAKVDFNISAKESEFASAPPAGSKESIEAVFRKKANDIKGCYQSVINAQGKASGRFVLFIAVAKDGSVSKVDKLEDQIGGTMFECVRKRIMYWKFGSLKAPIAFKKTWIFN